MTSPIAQVPKCQCGLYAIGECVECSIPLCSTHGTIHADRFLCAKHLRAMLRQAARAEREVANEKAKAEQAEQDAARRAKELAEKAAAKARRAREGAARQARSDARRREAFERSQRREQRRLAQEAQTRAEEAAREADRKRAEEAARAQSKLDRILSKYECSRRDAETFHRRGISPATARRWFDLGQSVQDVIQWQLAGCETPAEARRYVEAGKSPADVPKRMALDSNADYGLCVACGGRRSENGCGCSD